MLRFAVGERVCCRTGAIEWSPGTVVALRYREEHWPEGRSAPYQIELDDGGLIFAPRDSDELIRAEATFQQLQYEEAKEGERQSTAYREDVVARYPRKHPALFEPTELARFLDPRLRALLEATQQQEEDDNAGESAATSPAPRSSTSASSSSAAFASLASGLLKEESRGLYSLPFATPEFCALLLDECEAFEAWCDAEGMPLHRPNTMNNHGAILDDFGMHSAMQVGHDAHVQKLMHAHKADAPAENPHAPCLLLSVFTFQLTTSLASTSPCMLCRAAPDGQGGGAPQPGRGLWRCRRRRLANVSACLYDLRVSQHLR